MNLINELESEKLHSDSMKAAAALWMERARQAEMKLAIAVYAAGGEVMVQREHLIAAPDLMLITEEVPRLMATRVRAVRKPRG